MATQSENQASNQLEFIKLKVFLYKYTPSFEEQPTQVKDFLKTAQFKVTLDDSLYFSKYDITKFIAGYNFEQDIYGNTYNWSVTLSDPILSSENLRTDLQADIENPQILNDKPQAARNLSRTQVPINLSTGGLVNLSQYELGSNLDEESATSNPAFDPTDVTVVAKLNRAHAEDFMTEKATDTGKVAVGIRLSDILQPYDMISVFLYKETTPLEDLTGVKTTVAGTPGDTAFERFTPTKDGIYKLKAEDLQKETILLSTIPDTGKTLFSNEINGFIASKTMVRRVGGVDSVRINGNGITRLFGATRRIIKSSLLQDTIYSTAELNNLTAFTVNHTIFANSSVEEILMDLFRFVYHINFDVNKTTETATGQTGSGLSLQGASQIITSFQFNSSFYDITELQLGNERQTNSFTIPPFLLAQVMKRRLYNYREVAQPTGVNLAILNGLINSFAVQTRAVSVDSVLESNTNVQNVYSNGTSPVVFDSSIAGLRTYFRFIQNVFEFFNPQTKTPFEIIDEIKKVAFVEIFETPEGVVVARNPKYNDIANVVYSSQLDVVEASYSETTDGLVSKMKVGYGHDVLGQQATAPEFAFTDGKFLLQYGFLESATDVNPNVKNDISKDNQVNLDRNRLIFRYAEFFLRNHNARLKTGIVTANLDPRVRVGMTYFDEKNNKFGYIVGLSKNVAIGQSTTMTLNLSYVRDAYNTTPGNQDGTTLVFEHLPTLVEIDGE